MHFIDSLSTRNHSCPLCRKGKKQMLLQENKIMEILWLCLSFGDSLCRFWQMGKHLPFVKQEESEQTLTDRPVSKTRFKLDASCSNFLKQTV